MSFYLYLPSNVCEKQYPTNIQSNFKTLLKQPIDLIGEYEVALTEIIYSPNYLANYGEMIFDKYNIKLKIKNNIDKNELANILNTKIRKFFVDQSDEEFQSKINNRLIPSFTNDLRLLYNGILTFKGNIALIVNNQPEIILQNGDRIDITRNNLSVSNYAAIYTNIIEEQFFGDSLSPILRCVNLFQLSKSNTISQSYDNPVYVRVNQTHISTINITIADLEGNLIEFDDPFAYVIITLHFRKKNELQYV